MNISGLVIITIPQKTEIVLQFLNSFDGMEVHKTLDNGKIIAVMERETTGEEVDAVSEINGVDGVVAVTMAYHHFEEEVDRMIDVMDQEPIQIQKTKLVN